MDWMGKSSTQFFHSPTPLRLKEKCGGVTDLLSVSEKVLPPCVLNPLLFNGHLQTLRAALAQDAPHVGYRRKIFHSDIGQHRGSFAVDFFTCELEERTCDSIQMSPDAATTDNYELHPSDDSRPQLLIVHGLTGGSHEAYVRHSISLLGSERSWEICVINSRGCANSSLTSNTLYNARATWDLRQVVKWFQDNFPNRPLFGLGFSLLANILTNYCGEEGSTCPLQAAVVCSNPFNLEVVSRAMLRTFLGRNVYLAVMGDAVKGYVRSNEIQVRSYTKLDYDKIMAMTTLTEIDAEIHCKTWGYPTVWSYYRDASSSDAVLAIQIPFLALHAEDDPIAVKEAIPYEEFQHNPCTVLCTTSRGGHIGWSETDGGRWYAKAIANFFNYAAFSLDLDIGSRGLEVRHQSDAVDEQMGFEAMRRKMKMK